MADSTMADSSSKPGVPPSPLQEAESHLSSLVYDMSRQVQGAMENMLKMIRWSLGHAFFVSRGTITVDGVKLSYDEIDQNSAGIMEEIQKCMDSALDHKRALEKEKEQFQKAAYTVIDMLNNKE